MPPIFEQIGAEHSLFRAERLEAPWAVAQRFCVNGIEIQNSDCHPSDDDHFVYDVIMKGLARGKRPFVSYFAEQWITRLYEFKGTDNL